MRSSADDYALLLFLDFDGVLHPTHNAGVGNFRCLPLLEDVLRAFPRVGIVIASSWRHQYAFDELVAFFAADMRERIIGMTRSVEVSGARNRHAEISDYLRFYAERRPYIVLDDSRFEFPSDFPHVLFCHSSLGFDATAAEQLTLRLRTMGA